MYTNTWGRGTLKIIKECKKTGLPEPIYASSFDTMAWVVVN
jgi:hypothetical protein